MDAKLLYAEVCSNASDGGVDADHVTSEIWVLEDRISGIVTATFILLILLVALPWNLLIIFTILKKKMFKQPTILLLLNLAINDLDLLLARPVDIWVGLKGEFELGGNDLVRCRMCFAGMYNTIFAVMSVYIIFLMSFDRFLFIYKPLKYETIVKFPVMVLILSLLWVLSIILSLLPLAGFGSIRFVPALLSCTLTVIFEREIYSIVVLIFFSVPIVITAVLNLWVAVIVQRNIRAIYGIRRSIGHTADSKTNQENIYKMLKKKKCKRQLNLLRTFGALFLTNTIAWVPTIVIATISGSGHDIPVAVYSVSHVFFISQVLLHPLVETILIQDVREPIKMMLCSCLRKRRRSSLEKPQRQGSDDSGCCGNKCTSCCGQHGFVTVLNLASLTSGCSILSNSHDNNNTSSDPATASENIKA